LTTVRNTLGKPLNLRLDALDGTPWHRLVECATNLAKFLTERRDRFFGAGPAQRLDLLSDSPQLTFQTREVGRNNGRRWGGVLNRLLRLRRCCFAVERTLAGGKLGDRISEAGRTLHCLRPRRVRHVGSELVESLLEAGEVGKLVRTFATPL